ncbi:MAG: 5'-3' exonuclease H3TH domain-containing protein [Candidatus Izemoplasmatales bacterium]
MSDTLLLIDGNNLAYRCKFVFQLSNRGQDVSVTYGFLKVLESLMKKFKPTSVIVAWDGKVPKFRRHFVPEYKINRHKDEDPEDRANFNRQMDELHYYILPRMGTLSVKRNYTEADDLLHQASIMSLHEESIIVTGDKDLLQSLSRKTKVYSPSKEKLYTVKDFEEEYDLKLSQYVWWKALQGDGSDNIPGVQKVGEVTATKILKEFDTIVALFSAIEVGDFAGKIADRIKEFGYERLVKNYKVMNLFTDRTGARYTLLEELKYYRLSDKKLVKNYLLRNAFVSLLDNLPNMSSNLTMPKLDTTMRCPVVVDERIPIENI